MNYIFASPTLDDFIRLLKAWRFWLLGALVGAVIGAAVYLIAPPPYRARATVNVNFNLEQAWPKESDRQQFYYLERETRMLEEVAWSDDVMNQLSTEFTLPVEDLRGGKLLLSQPAEAGWHFYADDGDAKTASAIASAWAETFAIKAQAGIDNGTINQYIKMDVTQSAGLPVRHSISLGVYLLSGTFGFLMLAALGVLFIKPKLKSDVN
jgi:hypothetical protein